MSSAHTRHRAESLLLQQRGAHGRPTTRDERQEHRRQAGGAGVVRRPITLSLLGLCVAVLLVDPPQTREAMEGSGSESRSRVPVDAGEPAGYGSIAASVYTEVPRNADDVESAPLLTPQPGAQPGSWLPLTKEELEAAAGGPRWTKIRSRLVFLFWLSWLAMLGTAVAIIVQSPRPVATPLRWWQKSLFYQLQPALFMDSQPGTPGGIEAVCDHLSYIKSLGVGTIILEGLFLKGPSPDGPVINESLVTVPQMQHLLKESSKVGLRVVLDLCALNLTSLSGTKVSEVNDTSVLPEQFTTVQHTLRSWLEKGVAGFALCDTDPAFSERTLTEWRLVMKQFGGGDDDRIVLVKQTGEDLHTTGPVNGSLVEVVMRSILPPARHRILSAQEVADSAAAACLRANGGDVWPSWMAGGRTSSGLQKLLLVLMMTLPGTPALRYGEEISSMQNVPLNTTLPDNEEVPSSATEKQRRLAVALFTALSISKAREEALLSGTFTPLAFNASAAANATLRAPVLGFLRSWGCVQLLVVLNVGPEPQRLDPRWAGGLPGTGVFVVGTGLDRTGAVSLQELTLRPEEAVVIKLIDARSFS